jgi:hypothetical protein
MSITSEPWDYTGRNEPNYIDVLRDEELREDVLFHVESLS